MRHEPEPRQEPNGWEELFAGEASGEMPSSISILACYEREENAAERS
jgi:hypothetical protein